MLITPDLVEQQCIELLGRKHVEHLARLERQLELPAQTIVRFNTVDLLDDDERTLAQNELPAVLLSVEDLDDDPELTIEDDGRRDALTLTWRLEVEIFDQGKDLADAKQRARWLAMTVLECLLQRLPRRSAPVESLRLTALRFATYGDRPALGRAAMSFRVVVPDSVTVRGGLPVDADDAAPAGAPGGPPATPYDVPVPWPHATHFAPQVAIAAEDAPPDEEP